MQFRLGNYGEFRNDLNIIHVTYHYFGMIKILKQLKHKLKGPMFSYLLETPGHVHNIVYFRKKLFDWLRRVHQNDPEPTSSLADTFGLSVTFLNVKRLVKCP